MIKGADHSDAYLAVGSIAKELQSEHHVCVEQFNARNLVSQAVPTLAAGHAVGRPAILALGQTVLMHSVGKGRLITVVSQVMGR